VKELVETSNAGAVGSGAAASSRNQEDACGALSGAQHMCGAARGNHRDIHRHPVVGPVPSTRHLHVRSVKDCHSDGMLPVRGEREQGQRGMHRVVRSTLSIIRYRLYAIDYTLLIIRYRLYAARHASGGAQHAIDCATPTSARSRRHSTRVE
jgi:hypothetical protein